MRHIDKPMGLGDGRSGERVEAGSTLLSPTESVVGGILVAIAVGVVGAGLSAGLSAGLTWVGEKVKKPKKRTA